MSMREEFEASFPNPIGVMWSDYHNQYVAGNGTNALIGQAMQNQAWAAWQASRAALVVELPKVIIDDDMNKAEWEAARDMRERCEEAIQAAGIPVKQP